MSREDAGPGRAPNGDPSAAPRDAQLAEGPGTRQGPWGAQGRRPPGRAPRGRRAGRWLRWPRWTRGWLRRRRGRRWIRRRRRGVWTGPAGLRRRGPDPKRCTPSLLCKLQMDGSISGRGRGQPPPPSRYDPAPFQQQPYGGPGAPLYGGSGYAQQGWAMTLQWGKGSQEDGCRRLPVPEPRRLRSPILMPKLPVIFLLSWPSKAFPSGSGQFPSWTCRPELSFCTPEGPHSIARSGP